MTDALTAYKLYTALKRHFSDDSYDYFKYNKKTTISENKFNHRDDRYYFLKLARNEGTHLEDFLISNFISNPRIWVGELISETGRENYLNWKRRKESLTYIFKNEIGFLENLNPEEINNIFKAPRRSHPKIIKLYLQKEISLETLIILDEILTFMKSYDNIINDPLYAEISRICRKYRPFMNIDKEKNVSILKSVVGI